MSGISTEEYGAGGSSSPTEGMSAGQRCQSIDSLAEWRSSEQVENGIPSTSPPFWDTDDDDECGPKPSELFGKFTWKIDNFRQLNKRELRSMVFEVGGYKWYILIYPQGCDVCNHLSLFLCVANHDKLLPGWSHFAQFTIAVVNKDPKKSKFSDTLHRFWKKEHDWGWKKFMEINKVYDGFVNDDTLLIKAQVQVIREKANRPFRCLDCQYRRELVRVYLSNVEQICRRFIEDRKNKLGKLIEDKMRWSSFCAFWTGIDQASRRRMSKDKSDTILRVVVKHFFVEKEVTSTLVMDSLHSGLKALEHQSKNKKGKLKVETEGLSDPMVQVEKDMFVLDDDVVLLLERVVSEPLPTTSLPPKEDKVSLNRAKDGGCCEEFNKESIERDERHLTDLGQRTIEIFVVAHIFSRIEVAYQEAVALQRQEELIREEEAAGQAEHELKAKRAAADKEKRAKKKQTKQKQNNRKSKDQQRDLKSALTLNERQPKNSADEKFSCELTSNPEHFMSEKMDTHEDASDVSYAGEDVVDPLHSDLDDRDVSLVNGDTDASERNPYMEVRSSRNSNKQPEKRIPIIDDSSSTCSTDSVPSVVSNDPHKGFSGHSNRSHTSPNRGKNQLGKALLSQESIAGHFGGMEADAAHLKPSMLYADKHLIEKCLQTMGNCSVTYALVDHNSAKKQQQYKSK
ncbi:MATH domain-containing protein At5g43560-like isoform X2 [Phalaenopsis equestris]|uniref:MATH domain-containing protein At5g43560-like isoform X2 n=1 Tax=Phalaenopsis equestris TaxID=78828 RepID=UPI0009E558F0|nr:MATH domain-containing protein At5g43560-like isoform X2 [Phalaenopsis equestris]